MSKDGLDPRDSRQTKLYIFCLNIRSLRSKLGQLEVVLEHNPTDILCLNEHWLTEDEVPMYVPKDFTIGSSYCRKPPKTHGGSSILVRDGIQYETVDATPCSLHRNSLLNEHTATVCRTTHPYSCLPDSSFDHDQQLLGLGSVCGTAFWYTVAQSRLITCPKLPLSKPIFAVRHSGDTALHLQELPQNVNEMVLN
ncbi:hypothetical protein J6590_012368 [Homalodisca vitripennis]|nr:hypothetical protein J6590_012368 [Homalodisca vitripennis]